MEQVGILTRFPRQIPVRPRPRAAHGLAVVAVVVAVSFVLAIPVPTVSPLIWSIAVGVIVAPLVRRATSTAPGVSFAGRHLLRGGVALLGLRISAGEIGKLGVPGLLLATGAVVLTFAITVAVGRWLRVPRDLALLVAAGSSICGASAIAGMNAVTRADKEHVAYAVATVTLFGTIAMLLVPIIGTDVLGLSAVQTGLWAGASIHEVAQVTAAGAAVSAAALKAATLIKLTRVVLLGPTVAVVGAVRSGGSAGNARRIRVPGFVLAFVTLVAVRSVAPVPDQLLVAATALSTSLLAAGLAALGLQIHVGALRAAGWRPLAVGLAAWLTAAIVGLLLVFVVRP